MASVNGKSRISINIIFSDYQTTSDFVENQKVIDMSDKNYQFNMGLMFTQFMLINMAYFVCLFMATALYGHKLYAGLSFGLAEVSSSIFGGIILKLIT